MLGDRAEGDQSSALIDVAAGEGGFELPPDVSASLLGLLWQKADAAMIVLDRTGRILCANPAAEKALLSSGYGVGDAVVGRSEVQEFTNTGEVRSYPDGEQPIERALRGITVTQESIAVHLPGDRGTRRLVVSVEPIRLDDGSGGALLGWNDVTDSWDVAERSRAELDRLGQLLQGACDYAIIRMDADGSVRSWSEAAERMQGYSAQEAIGVPYASFFDEEDRASGLPGRILAEAAERGKISVEGKRVRRDGSAFWARASITSIRGEDGELRGFIKVTHDASEQRAGQQATVEQNELLEEQATERTVELEQMAADLATVNAELEAFSYSISHDLRAPLRAMSGFAKIMDQEFGTELPDEARHYLSRVTENAQQMGNLIDALLSLSRMQQQSMHSSPIDMTDLVCECWTSLAPTRAERRIGFVLGALPAARGDRRLIKQVWMSLLDNAIKYTCREDVAQIEVSAQSSGDSGDLVMYLVKDNGAGFDMRLADKIGQIFQRLHHADDFAGTGIGLALVQRIVQRHGGQLSVAGAPGAGATFGFTLPRPA